MFGMVHRLPLTDFRARRSVLDPDDFAGGDDLPEPPPPDLIDPDTWQGIVGLPDDVSVRTSNRHGGLLRIEHEILGVWLHALPEPDDLDFDRPLDPAMLDVADELPAATFELLNGYYRQAASTLRSAFEIMLAGSHAVITNGRRGDFSYRASSHEVGGSVRAAQLDTRLRVVCGRCVFADARHAPWCGDLYSRLTDYAHAKPGWTLGDIRKSNGPIYVEKAVREIECVRQNASDGGVRLKVFEFHVLRAILRVRMIGAAREPPSVA